MLDRDINLNPGRIITIHNNKMWDDLPFRKCNLSIDRNEHKFNIESNKSNSGDKWNKFKSRRRHFIRLNINSQLQK